MLKQKLLLVLAALAPVAVGAQGVERWPIKTSLPPEVNRPVRVPIDKLVALPDVPGVRRNDIRFQDTRIPLIPGWRVAEGELVWTEGWMHLVAHEGDGDLHIQLSASPTDGNHCVVVEVPTADAKHVKSDERVRSAAAAVRQFLSTLAKPHNDVFEKPIYVRVMGQLFYDDAHVTYGKPPERGKKGMKCYTLWELHPVLAMAVADPAQPMPATYRPK